MEDGSLIDRLRRIEAHYQLGLFPSEKWPDLAEEALLAGLDSPSLVLLAGLHQPGTEVDALLYEALKEIGCETLSREQAVRLVATEIAAEMVARRLDAYEGMLRLGRLYWAAGEPHFLENWWLWESEYEGPESRRAEVLSLFLDEAWKLVKKGG